MLSPLFPILGLLHELLSGMKVVIINTVIQGVQHAYVWVCVTNCNRKLRILSGGCHFVGNRYLSAVRAFSHFPGGACRRIPQRVRPDFSSGSTRLRRKLLHMQRTETAPATCHCHMAVGIREPPLEMPSRAEVAGRLGRNGLETPTPAHSTALIPC